MSVVVSWPVDPLVLTEAIADGMTSVSLWYSNTPDGSYADTGATPSPTTLALMSSGETYTATFTYSAGNASQWGKVRFYDGATYSDISLSVPFHFGGGTNLVTLRQKLGREIHDMRTGTLSGSTTATNAITASTDLLRFQSNYFNKHLINNTTRSTWSQVTTSTNGGTSTTMVCAPTIASQASGDSIEVMRRFTPDEYRDAINWAIRTSYPVLVRPIVSTNILTATNIYQYDVPQDFRDVHSVELESWNFHTSDVEATRGFPWTQLPFKLVRDGIRLKLEFDKWYSPDLRLRLTGTGPLSQLYSDSDYVEVVEPQTDLIIYYAAFHLFRGLAADSAASSDIDRYTQLSEHYMTLATQYRDTFTVPRPAKRGWTAEQRANHRGSGLIGSFNPSNFP